MEGHRSGPSLGRFSLRFGLHMLSCNKSCNKQHGLTIGVGSEADTRRVGTAKGSLSWFSSRLRRRPAHRSSPAALLAFPPAGVCMYQRASKRHSETTRAVSEVGTRSRGIIRRLGASDKHALTVSRAVWASRLGPALGPAKLGLGSLLANSAARRLE